MVSNGGYVVDTLGLPQVKPTQQSPFEYLLEVCCIFVVDTRGAMLKRGPIGFDRSYQKTPWVQIKKISEFEVVSS